MTSIVEERALKLFDKHRDNGFTSSSVSVQVKKLNEEIGEFLERVMEAERARNLGMHLEATHISNLLDESGDVAWMLVDILHTLGVPRTLSLTDSMVIALKKLEDRHGKA